jgi:diacylglycerol kinase family enzyme
MDLRVTLMHNPTAGDEEHSREGLESVLADAGHEVLYQSLKEDDWKTALRQATELVVVAGGDGAVCKVFTELAGSALAVTLLPVGSANNIARTLGISEADPGQLARCWHSARRRPYDLGRAESASHAAPFFESMGGGIFAEVLSRAESAAKADGKGKVEHGLELLREVISEASPLHWDLRLDDHNLSGKFLAVEAMNVREIGPNVLLAPEADPGDSMLDVVLIRPADRAAWVAYVEARIEGCPAKYPRPHSQRGRRLAMRPSPRCLFHVDDDLWPEESPVRLVSSATVSTGETRLEMVVPSPT